MSRAAVPVSHAGGHSDGGAAVAREGRLGDQNAASQGRKRVDSMSDEDEKALCDQFVSNVAVANPAPQSQAEHEHRHHNNYHPHHHDHYHQHQQQVGQPGPWHGRPVQAVAERYAAESFACRFEAAMRIDADEASEMGEEPLPIEPDDESLSGGDMDDAAARQAEEEFHMEHGSELCFLLNRFRVDGKSNSFMPYIC